MEFLSRSYNPGPVFRPKPFVLERPENSLLIVTTSWSAQAEASKAAQLISDFIDQQVADEKKPLRERLQLAVAGAGQAIFRQDNSKQLRLLVEALVVQVEGQSVAWAQTGQPNLYLMRKGRMAPLVVQPDHSLLDPALPPLPSVGLGLESQTPVQSGVATWLPSDQLLFLAQAWEPAWPSAAKATGDFQTFTTELIKNQPDLAFWCGHLSF